MSHPDQRRGGCGAAAVAAAVRAAAATIAEHHVELSRLDREIGDGDHGANLNRGFSAVVGRLDADPPATPGGVLKLVATTLISTVGGASGPLFGTAFLRAATAVGDASDVDAALAVAALGAARDGVVARGKANPGEKTMVDALTPAVEAATAASVASVASVLRAAATAATEGAAATVAMVARKGRASYLGERSAGHADPGATSTSMILAALADSTG